ncbi:MAG: PQQ-like beta-propeller repeat protein [Gemmatimonadota bacterium]|nr:PQQ-like beta-propeller repeat protein [Gemmatimonadota bacterium]
MLLLVSVVVVVVIRLSRDAAFKLGIYGMGAEGGVRWRSMTRAAGGSIGIVWRAPLPGRATDSIPATDGERIYAVFGDAGVVAIRPSDGAVLWHGTQKWYLPMNAAVRGGLVFTAEAIVVARDSRTGELRWEFTPDANASMGRLAADESAVYFGTGETSHTLYALSATDGTLLWRTKLGPDWEYKAWVEGVSVTDDIVYAGVTQFRAHNGYLSSAWTFAIDRGSGRVLWSYQAGSGADARTTKAGPTVADNRLLISDYGANAAYALDRFTGRELWRTEFDNGFVGPREPPIVDGALVYVGSGDCHLYALDPASGRVVWCTNVEASIHAVAVCGKRILVQMLGLAVIDRRTGRRLGWMFDEGEFPTSGFAVLGEQAFVSGNKAMYLLDCR